MNIKRALIITDVQKDFCPGGTLAVGAGNLIVPVINTILKNHSFYKIVATQDWHPKNHRSFASNNKGHSAYDIIDGRIGIDVLWPDHCIKGTRGAEFHDDLILDEIDMIIRKGANADIDSYSTFLENDKLTPTGLANYLKEHNISHVYLCGIATDVCVYYSALDAVDYGFETYVISDAVAGVDLPMGNIHKTCEIMKTKGIHFISSKTLDF